PCLRHSSMKASTWRRKAGSRSQATRITYRRSSSAAARAIRAAFHLHDADLGGEAVIEHEAAGERVAETENFLQHFRCLQRAEDARDGAENAGGLATRDEVGRRLFGEDAAITGVGRAGMRLEDAELPIKAQQRGRYQRALHLHTHVVEQIA